MIPRPRHYECLALPAELQVLLVFSLPLNNHIAIPVLLPGAYHLRGVITTLKFDPNSLKLLHPCHALVNKVLVELVSKSYRFFVPSMYIMTEVWLDLHHVSANFTRWLHFRIGLISPDL